MTKWLVLARTNMYTMSAEPSRKDLIDWLIQDRNHHFDHPHQLAIKFFYSLGASLTTIFISFLAKSSLDGNVKEQFSSDVLTWVFMGLTLMGFFVIFWGISEHSKLHLEQQKRIERAIEYLLTVRKEDYSLDKFWAKFGHVKLQYKNGFYSDKPTSLFVAEPDTRDWKRYHDRKFEAGVLVIVVGVIGIIVRILLTK